MPMQDAAVILEQILGEGGGPRFREQACKLGLEGVISKLADRPYAPDNRGIWVKSKCLNREEFVVVGWTDPAGSPSHLGALLLGYYSEDGQLRYAGRAGTGMTDKELKRLAGVLKPLTVPKMPLAEPPPRDSRFGSPLKLSRVHWVRPEVVVEVTYLASTEDNYCGRSPIRAAGGQAGKASRALRAASALKRKIGLWTGLCPYLKRPGNEEAMVL